MAPPSKKTPEICDDILEQVASGKPLTEILARDGMPHVATWFRWMEADPALRERYKHAQGLQLDAYEHQLVHIADNSEGDYKTVVRKGTEELVVDWENVKRSELRIRTRQWILSKLRRNVWGSEPEEGTQRSVAQSILELIKVVAGIAQQSPPVIEPPPVVGSLHDKNVIEVSQNTASDPFSGPIPALTEK